MAEDIRALEQKIRNERSAVNEIVPLMSKCERGGSRARLAALQACRSLFMHWASIGELRVHLTQPEDADAAEAAGEPTTESAMVAYRRWLHGKYKDFIVVVRKLLESSKTPLALRLSALDTLMLLAASEVRHARRTRGVHFAALTRGAGVLCQLVEALLHSASPIPEEVLERLRSAHLQRLDVSYYFLKHLLHVVKLHGADQTLSVPRLIDLLTLVKPPTRDVQPKEALFLVERSELEQSAASLALSDKSRPNHKRSANPGARWPAEARRLLRHRLHRLLFYKCWRALLHLNPPAHSFRRVLQLLPSAVLPYVPNPLRFCDLLSDGYERGGLDAILALKGLLHLMLKHNLEYPRFYTQLYAVLTLEAIEGPHCDTFATELQLVLSSTGLPDYMLAAFAKRLARLALHSAPAAAALSCALIFNLMLRHPSVRVLINRPLATHPPSSSSATQTELQRARASDPFLPDEIDPEHCRAIESCLWEVDTLRSHFCPTVVLIASLFAKPIEKNTPPVELSPLAQLSYTSIAELEASRRTKEWPMAIRKPVALFGKGVRQAGFSDGGGLDQWC